MGHAENAPGRFAFCPELKLQLAMGCDVRGEAIASGQGDYCNGDPVNGLDPDGRFGKNAIEDVDNVLDPSSGFYGQDVANDYFQYEGQQDAQQVAHQNFLDSLSPSQLTAYGTSNVIQGVVPGAADEYQAYLQFQQGNYGNAAGFAGLSVASDAFALLGMKVAGSTGGAPEIVPGDAGLGYFNPGGPPEGTGFMTEDGFVSSVPNDMRSGQLAEGPILDSLGSSGKVPFTPTADQINSAAFNVIVGEPQYTSTGAPVGTIFDGSTAK